MFKLRTAPVILLLICLAVVPAFPAEEPTDQKQRDIVHLITMTGAENLGLQFAQAVNRQFSMGLRSQNPDIPDKAFTILAEELTNVFTNNIASFVAMIVPIYDKHFTHEEIKGLIAFYETDLGKKAIAVIPQVMDESMQAGQQWGRELAPTLVANLKARFAQEGIPYPE